MKEFPMFDPHHGIESQNGHLQIQKIFRIFDILIGLWFINATGDEWH